MAKRRAITKTVLTECWKMQGQWEEAVKVRDAAKVQALNEKFTKDSAVLIGWETAQQRFPILPATLEEYYRLKTIGPKLRLERAVQMEQEKQAKRSQKIENRTGVPLYDWVYANISGEISEEPAKGDLDFLIECRKNPDEFYKKFYLPALMKAQGLSPQDGPIQDASERSTEGLLKLVREAAKA